MIGQLSEKYESKGNIAAIGYDAGGGWSYGMNQIATKTGTFSLFIDYCRRNYPDLFQEMIKAGGVQGATKGTPQFKQCWVNLAKQSTDKLTDAQHGFIVETQYDMAIHRLQTAGIDLSKRSDTLADVIYSMSVMAGPGAAKPNGSGSCGLIYDAVICLGGLKELPIITDDELIPKIYDLKLQRIDSGREYSNQNTAVKESVRKRVLNEKADALTLYAKEINPNTNPVITA